MAEAIGLAASAVTLAALFSSCIDCFSYFKAAQDCSAEAETLLVKLDCEKARLLVWANNVGILQVDLRDRHPELANVATDNLIRRCIEQIIGLLTDAQKLQDEYGGQRATQADEQRTLTVVSANSMSIFKTSKLRFFSKVSIPKEKLSWLSRIKWAIRDSSRFEALLLNLKDFVDNLIQLVPLPLNLINDSVGEDIATIIDIEALKLTESACEHSYPAWSARASEVIKDSEMGTTDRRNFEEFFNDTTDVEISNKDKDRAETVEWLSNLPIQLESCFMVATEPCLDIQPTGHCDSNAIQSTLSTTDKLSFACDNSLKWSLGRRIMEHLKPPFGSQRERDEFESHIYKMSEISGLTPHFPPRSMIYIYCGPCVCAIRTALEITYANVGIPSFYYTYTIRIDHRIKTNCRRSSPIVDVLGALHEAVQGHADLYSSPGPVRAIGFIDVPALEVQLFELEEDTIPILRPDKLLPTLLAEVDDSHEPNKLNLGAVIFIVEAEICQVFMENHLIRTSARKPRETEIYTFKREFNSREYTRKFLGKYVKSEPALKKARDRQDMLPASGVIRTARTSNSTGSIPQIRRP